VDRLSEIPIRIEYAASAQPNDDRLSPAGLAVLRDIERLLGEYQAFGHAGSIDLRWLPLLPGDLERLKDILGTGEVGATIAALGSSTAQETAIQCVWWITHRGTDDAMIGHWIEITEVPSLLRSDRSSIPYALQTLRERAISFGGATLPFTNEPDARGGTHYE
jgi:hydrogenase-1 operon protein HyaF